MIKQYPLLLCAGLLTFSVSHAGLPGAIDSATRKNVQTQTQDNSGLSSNNVANPTNTTKPTGVSTQPKNVLGDGDDPGKSLMQMSGLDGVAGGASGGANPSLRSSMKINKDVKLICQTPPYKMQPVEDIWFMQTAPCQTQTVDGKSQITQMTGRWCFLDRTSGGGCGRPNFAGAWLPTDGLALPINMIVTLPTPPLTEGYGTTAKPGTISLSCLLGKTYCTGNYRDTLELKTTGDTMTSQGSKNQQAADSDSVVRSIQTNSANPVFRQSLSNQPAGTGVDLDACVGNTIKGVTSTDGKMKTCNPDTAQQKDVISPVVSASAGKVDCKDAISCVKSASTTSRWSETCESQIPLQLQQCETNVPVKQCNIYRPYDYVSCEAKRVVSCKTTGSVLANTCTATVVTGAEISQGKLTWDGSVPRNSMVKKSTTFHISGLSRVRSATLTRLGYDDWVQLRLNNQIAHSVVNDFEYDYGDNGMGSAVGSCTYFGDGCYESGANIYSKLGVLLDFKRSIQPVGGSGGWHPIQAESINLKPFLIEGDNTVDLYTINTVENGNYHLTIEFDEYCVSCTDTVDRSDCATEDAVATP